MIKYTPGNWILATSCSWRRIIRESDLKSVCVPTNNPNDSHPDLIGKKEDLLLMSKSNQMYKLLLEILETFPLSESGKSCPVCGEKHIHHEWCWHEKLTNLIRHIKEESEII